jgi:hypothetical protein
MAAGDPISKLKAIHQEAQLRSQTPPPSPPKPTSNKNVNVLQLPIWPEERRGVPNDLVRSALFTVGNHRKKREFRKNHLIAALGDISIMYTGEELRQDDEDVFLQLAHLARLTPLGHTVEFTAHAMMKSLGWSTDGRAYERLRDCISRLSATGIEVRSDNRGYSGSLVRDFAWQDLSGRSSRRWKVRLEPRIIALFGKVAYTSIDWQQRLQLGYLAKWLHSFYYTHAHPYPMKVATLRKLCGSGTRDLSKFRQLLRSALDELKSVEFLSTWHIDSKTDLVHVTRLAALSGN